MMRIEKRPVCFHCGGHLYLNLRNLSPEDWEEGEAESRCIKCDKFTKVSAIIRYQLSPGKERDDKD